MKTFDIEIHHLNKIELVKVEAKDAEEAIVRLELGEVSDRVFSEFDKITPYVCDVKEEG